MSRIDELIEEHCQQGVEVKNLGEVCIIKTGSNISKEEIAANTGPYPVLNSGADPLGFYKEFNTENDAIGIASRGSVGLVTWIEGRYFRGNLNYSATVRDELELNQRFLFHFLLSVKFEIDQLCTFQGIPALNKSNLEKLRVPVPPLDVQHEIVRILDQFTELEAELEAELEDRRKQYEHYRNALFTFTENEVRWVPMGEFADCYSGATPRTGVAEYWENGTIPWMNSGEVNLKTVSATEKRITDEGFSSCSTKMVPANSVVIALAGQGRTRGLVARTRIDLCTNQSLCAIVPTGEVHSDFIYHYLSSKYEELRRISSGDGTRGGLNLEIIRNFHVPVPTFERQGQISAILNKFEALVNDIKSGLPAEIEARRKQYEYYRDKLLTFPEAAA